MPRTQTTKNKIGEINFRRKLAEQFEGKKIVFPGEPSGEEYTEIIKGRIKDYTSYFNRLKELNILHEPYLELGAGVSQGAMLLENTYNLQGLTSDISFETLGLAPKYQRTLKYKKMPFRICCDIYNLPFRTDSIPFIFTFQTIHHLPDPYPVLKEIKRVVAPNGYFYFNEEPIAQALNLNLWRRDRHLRWFEKILKSLIILHFISRIGKSEVEHNILEETFSQSVWERALNLFPYVTVNLKAFPFGPTIIRSKTRKKNWVKGSLFKQFMLDLMGGGIEAICQKTSNKTLKKSSSLLDCLACPNCKSKPQLHYQSSKRTFLCKKCKTEFPIKNDILILLSNDQKKILY